MTPFVQPAPRLANAYASDPLLPTLLRRKLAPELHAAIEPELLEMGALAAGPLFEFQRADRANEPVLTQWDAWGNRVDRIELSPLWREAERLAARHGLVAIPYERREGAWSRLRQFALVYLFHPVTDVYTCPLAMTDGAARTWLASAGDAAVVQAGARRVTLTLGRALELALLAEHAGASDGAARVEAVDWCRRLHRAGIDLLADPAPGSRQ